MIFHEYDAQGFLVGWHEDAKRPNSTSLPPAGILPHRARWDGAKWVDDPTRDNEAEAELTKRQQAIQRLRAFDATTATADDTRKAVAAIIRVLGTL